MAWLQGVAGSAVVSAAGLDGNGACGVPPEAGEGDAHLAEPQPRGTGVGREHRDGADDTDGRRLQHDRSLSSTCEVGGPLAGAPATPSEISTGTGPRGGEVATAPAAAGALESWAAGVIVVERTTVTAIAPCSATCSSRPSSAPASSMPRSSGPLEIIKPDSRVNFAHPSAANAAVCSWRASTTGITPSFSWRHRGRSRCSTVGNATRDPSRRIASTPEVEEDAAPLLSRDTSNAPDCDLCRSVLPCR